MKPDSFWQSFLALCLLFLFAVAVLYTAGVLLDDGNCLPRDEYTEVKAGILVPVENYHEMTGRASLDL